MGKHRTKQGFTIIEVVLVLAIAGLIFLMVFVAFPALQRNQRDAQRRQDLANVSAQLKNFALNGNSPVDVLPTANQTNPEALPTGASSTCNVSNSKTIGNLNTMINNSSKTIKEKLACKFLRYYPLNEDESTSNDSTEANKFQDPEGGAYALYMVNRLAPSNASGNMTGAYGYEYDYKGTKYHYHYIVVTFNTQCSADSDATAMAKSIVDPTAYTVRYAMEGGDIYCQDGRL